jgi:hypothetical protein
MASGYPGRMARRDDGIRGSQTSRRKARARIRRTDFDAVSWLFASPGHGARGRVTKATAIRGAAVFRLPHRALPGETIAQQGITSSRPELRLARHGERLQVGPSRRNHGRRRNVDAGFGLRPIRVRSVGSVVGTRLEDFRRDCLAQLGSLRFRIAVGNGRKVRWPPIYNFSGAMVLRSVKETSMTRAPRLKGTAHHSPSAFSS